LQTCFKIFYKWLLPVTFSTLPFLGLGQGNFNKEDSVNKRDLLGLIRLVFHKRADQHATPTNSKKIYYSFLPVSSQVPGAGIALITTTTAGFYMGSRENTSLSTVAFSPYITFSGRIGFALRSGLWLPANRWEIMGDSRFLYYPQYTWGLGGNSADGHRLLVNYQYVRFYQSFLRAIKPYFLAGIGYYADAHFDIDTFNDSPSVAKFTGYPYGTSASENSFSSGLALNLLYDSRRNDFNPFPGFYANAVYRFNPHFFGSNQNWQSLYLDLRRYISFSRTGQNMIAVWAYYWTALQSHTPYLDLPSIGWDPYGQRSGRGFPQNRYRGNRLLYFESEYRRDITRDGLLGFVLFANVNSVSEPLTNQFSYLHPAVGTGLRIKFNKHSGTNISLDYAVSLSYRALYLNLGETF